MVPTNWLAVVLFIVLVAPGLLFDLLATRRRASPAESAFREAGRVVLASLVFDLFAFGVLALAQRVKPSLLPDPSAMLRGGAAYVADHYNLVLGTIFVQTLLAMGAAYGFHLLLARRYGAATQSISAWTRVLKHERPNGTKPHARIRLTNGTVYFGEVASYTSDHELGDREMVLAPPLYSKAPGEGLKQLPSGYSRVVLRGGAIDVISVRYVPDPAAEETRGERLRDRVTLFRWLDVLWGKMRSRLDRQ